MNGTREADGGMVRAFLAAGIGDDVRAALARAQARLKRAGARVGWVEPENIHVTLVFLGDVDAAQLAPLGRALDAAVAGRAPFGCEVHGLGGFGPPRAPRVLWAGVRAGAQALTGLHACVAAAVAGLGLRTEERPFHPHLTLGRVRPGGRGGLEALTAELGSANNTAYGRVEVGRVLLMRSHLRPQGVRYSVVHEAMLKGAQGHG